MILAGHLNMALCYLKLGKFGECISSCDKVTYTNRSLCIGGGGGGGGGGGTKIKINCYCCCSERGCMKLVCKASSLINVVGHCIVVGDLSRSKAQCAEQQILFAVRLACDSVYVISNYLYQATSFLLRFSLRTSLLAEVSTGQKIISFLSYRDFCQQATFGQAASD